MTDPPCPLVESGDEFERALLGSARLDVGSRAGHARCAAVVASSLALSTKVATASAGGAAVATSGLALAAKWIGIGMIVGAGVGGVTAVGVRSVAGPSGMPHAAPAAASMVPENKFDLAAAPPIGELGLQDEPSAARAPPVPTAQLRAPSGRPEPAQGLPEVSARAALPSADDALEREVAFLDTARVALKQADPTRALAALEQHRRTFPAGVLAPEALVIRVQVLLAQGDRGSAEALARSLLTSHPEGPHAKRLREILGQTNP